MFKTEVQTQFDKLYDQACNLNDDSKIVILVFQMIQILTETNQAYTTDMHCKQMGIHPKNRSGKKMVGQVMHKKGKKIYTVGFLSALCGPEKAIAFENNPNTNSCETHTLESTTSDLFGRYEKGTIRAGSVGCSHLNQFLAAVHDEVQTEFEPLCEHGKKHMCARMIVDGNTELHTAVFKGLRWTVIKWPIEVKYPHLPTLIQRALNVEHHVGEGDSTANNKGLKQ